MGETGQLPSRNGAGYFGAGGRYGAELHARASMLKTLEASIRLLYERTLEVLMRELAEETADVS